MELERFLPYPQELSERTFSADALIIAANTLKHFW
jgi:hypothetical protein